jgi:hypothetical protein
MGGGILTKSFGEADLIDIWSVAFVPAFLGAGLPMFPPAAFAERRVRLTRTHTYPSSASLSVVEEGEVGAGDTIRWVTADAVRPAIARLIGERYISAMDRIESLP